MKQPVQIVFLGMSPSEAMESAIRDKVAKLEQICSDIVSCRVSVESSHKHSHQGRPFHVSVDLTVPGQELTVNRIENEDAHVAMRDAFDAMRRQLDEVVRRRRGE